MRCTNCGYALWNLMARECPECGQSFRPSDYEFVPNTVEFRCPHCRSAHVGDGASGRPASHEIDCKGCGTRITVDEMTVVPREGVREEQTRPGLMPWLERQRIGRARALGLTVHHALFRPRAMIRGVPRNAPTGELLALGSWFVFIASLCGILPLFWWDHWDTWYAWSPDVFDWVEFTLTVIGSSILVLGLVAVSAMLVHLALRLTGSNRGSLDRTIHAVACSAPTMIIIAIPILGWLFGWIAWAISATIMLREAHGVSYRRAGVAVLALPVTLVMILTIVAALVAFDARTRVDPWSNPMMGLHYGILSYSWQQNGSGPDHVAELLLSYGVAVSRSGDIPFCHPGTRTTPSEVPLGTATLEEFIDMDSRSRFSILAELLANLPQDIVAHRLGDYVFTYHGGQVNSHDPSFWHFIMLPDPDQNEIASWSDVEVLAGDGSIQRMTYRQLLEMIPAQNSYRQGIGLQPLPNPATVTHSAPAVFTPDRATDVPDVTD
jgi:predicted RNA-binding Zn-ribbon protein involved in translation (DUF1610 family)